MEISRTNRVMFGVHFFVIVICLLSNPSSVAAQNAETNAEGKFEIRLRPEKETIMLGEPLFFSFDVTNLSGETVWLGLGADYRNKFGRPNSFKVSISTRDGMELPQLEAPDFGGFISSQRIEPQGTYSVKLFLSHWATIERTGRYRINVSRKLGFSIYETPTSRKPKYSMQADVNADFTVVPYDENKMGGVINSLGSIMLDISDPRAADSAQALASINDKREITYFVEALRKFRDFDFGFDNGEYSIGSRAIYVLGTYDDDRAIEALQDAMNSPTDKTRLHVASALGDSPHRLATGLLMKMQDDSYYFVRLRVAQGLKKVRTKRSLAVLHKLLKDKNEDVRQAAQESLNELEKQ